MLECTQEVKFTEAVERLERCAAGLPVLRQALSALLAAESHLLTASSKVDDIPESDRICSLAQSVEDIEGDVRKQITRMEKMI